MTTLAIFACVVAAIVVMLVPQDVWDHTKK